MKLLYLILYSICNQKCIHCPMKGFSFTNTLTNTALLKWVDKYIDPINSLIEITGGEPALYPEIETLIPELNKRGYKGLIKTNGTLPMPRTNNFKKIGAWHKANKTMPVDRDLILILRNPDDNWQEKEKYCIDNNILYAVFDYQTYEAGDRHGERKTVYPNCILKEVTVIHPDGNMTDCFCNKAIENKSVFNMDEPVFFDLKKCPLCGNVSANEYFLKKLFKNEFNFELEKWKI